MLAKGCTPTPQPSSLNVGSEQRIERAGSPQRWQRNNTSSWPLIDTTCVMVA
jgi:hypothetical protein